MYYIKARFKLRGAVEYGNIFFGRSADKRMASTVEQAIAQGLRGFVRRSNAEKALRNIQVFAHPKAEIVEGKNNV